jgi:hypothetical protein
MRNGKLGTVVECVAPGLWLVRAGSVARRIKSSSTAPFARTIILPDMNETPEQRAWLKQALTAKFADEMMTLTIIDGPDIPAPVPE